MPQLCREDSGTFSGAEAPKSARLCVLGNGSGQADLIKRNELHFQGLHEPLAA